MSYIISDANGTIDTAETLSEAVNAAFTHDGFPLLFERDEDDVLRAYTKPMPHSGSAFSEYTKHAYELNAGSSKENLDEAVDELCEQIFDKYGDGKAHARYEIWIEKAE